MPRARSLPMSEVDAPAASCMPWAKVCSSAVASVCTPLPVGTTVPSSSMTGDSTRVVPPGGSAVKVAADEEKTSRFAIQPRLELCLRPCDAPQREQQALYPGTCRRLQPGVEQTTEASTTRSKLLRPKRHCCFWQLGVCIQVPSPLSAPYSSQHVRPL